MKKYTKLIAIILFLAIILGCMPIVVVATETEQVSTQIEEEILAPEDTKVTELVSVREENVKHFKLPNGTYEAVSYGQAVHRKDANGVWQDINNDLTLKTVGTKQLYTTSDERVSFNKEANAVTLSENGYSISMTLLTQQSSGNMTATTAPMTIAIDNQSVARAEHYDTLEKAIEINNKSSIVYSNVMANTDIEYIMSGNDLKENIIVKAKGDSYEYGFQLALSGLVPVLENNVISLRDETTDEEKYIIPAPYMYDANGEYSYDVEYGLVHAGGEKYLLTVTANAEWINDESRAMPVTIDPTLNSSIIADTYIVKTAPAINHGSSTRLWVSQNEFPMIKPDIPEIPEAATFNYAKLYTSYYSYSANTSVTVTINAYEILASWSESSVTYNSQTSVSTTALCSVSVPHSSSITLTNPGTAIFDISGPVSDYYDEDAFYGVMLMPVVQTNDIPTPFFAKEYGQHIPYLRVNYSNDISGIYAFENNLYPTNWIYIDTEIKEGTKLKHKCFDECPVLINKYNNSGILKITQVGTTQRYILRVMIASTNLTFQVSDSGNELVASHCPPSDTEVPAQKTFFIEWNGEGYNLRPYGSTKVIWLENVSTENLTLKEQKDFGNKKNATWTLVEYSVMFYGIEAGSGHDHITTPETIRDTYDNNLWYNINIREGVVTAEQCTRDLETVNIFITRGHGTHISNSGTQYATGILLNDASSGTQELLVSHNYSGLTGNYVAIDDRQDLSNIDLAIFAGCRTGEGGAGGKNLPTALVDKGANTAIGFIGEMDCGAVNRWVEQFFKALYLGKTVLEAVNCACSDSAEHFGNFSDPQRFIISGAEVVICGNTNLTLK